MRFTVFVIVVINVGTAFGIEPPPGAVIIPIDLAKPVIRVVADCKHDPPEHVLVDIGFSQHLTQLPVEVPERPFNPTSTIVHTDEKVIEAMEAVAATTDEYTAVGTGIRDRDEFHGVFEAGIQDTIVGIWVKRINRRNQLLIELRPMYVLPSGGKMTLARTDGLKTLTLANRLHAEAISARNAIPELRSAIRIAESEYERYLREARALGNGRTLDRFAAGAPNPQAMANDAFQRGRALARQLRRAESIAERLPVIERDGMATVGVAKYAASIKDKASIYVRVYNGKATLPASVR